MDPGPFVRLRNLAENAASLPKPNDGRAAGSVAACRSRAKRHGRARDHLSDDTAHEVANAIKRRSRSCLFRVMKDEKENIMLLRVVADICELLGNAILLAPTEQREELCRFALTEVAAISDVFSRTQH
jgi:hypothetical protein